MKRPAIDFSVERERNDPPPLRAELFSTEQMQAHGRVLATLHRVAEKPPADNRLLDRLADNEAVLVQASRMLTASPDRGSRRITPAAEWLLDNFYLIEEQIRTARRHLSPTYGRQLPHLAEGPSAALPRVHELAQQVIAHGDGRLDLESLRRFIAAYQSEAVLTLGELWAVPIMLRLALVENLRRIAHHIVVTTGERELAASWAARMIEQAERDPKDLVMVLADMARAQPPMSCSFVAELVRQLQQRGQAMALPLSWIDQHLADEQMSIEHAIQLEGQRQATNQVSISNSIGSLRLLDAVDWRDFVEEMSVVEQSLRQDPAAVYARMDFSTRDRYRHAVEETARRTARSEAQIAGAALELARAAALEDPGGAAPEDARPGERDSRRAHVGYYLIGKGQALLRQQLGAAGLNWIERLRSRSGGRPLLLYLGAIAALTVLTACALLSRFDAALARWVEPVLGLAALLAASQLAVTLVNWVATLLVRPDLLPAMDFSKGIPAQWRTLVVVPSMLGSTADADELAAALEVRFLANRDRNLYFALLTDFPDADTASTAHDAAWVEHAAQCIQALNARYRKDGAHGGPGRFFLFHRPRQWNPCEGKWMGHERKRGKLAALNALLRGQGQAAFATVVGDLAVLQDVKLVITLDTDTLLPRDAGRQLVGLMAHPLNRPRHEAQQGRVVEGYGILQPAVATTLAGSARSRYARLYCGEAGIDPYTRASSDVYQDLFGEGSFIGKGIYDVDAVERSMAGRFPDNLILSHDLLEGCHARAGLASHVPVFEDAPFSFAADAKRRHRWMRGDWQLFAWLRRRVPVAARAGQPAGRREANPLSALSRWKIFDNLRRSLVPIALLALLLAGWLLLPNPLSWTLLVLSLLILPSLCEWTMALLRRAPEARGRPHLARLLRTAGRRLAQIGFELACLPHTAWSAADAILRSLWRCKVSRKRLLEWNPSRETERALDRPKASGIGAHVRMMWMAPATALASVLLLCLLRPPAPAAAMLAPSTLVTLLIAAPVLLLWLGAPLIAWWLSRPPRSTIAPPTAAERRFLGALARRTWAYFDAFSGPLDNWLAPDNVQEGRNGLVAHRTSPTNIGLGLLARLAAHDFGYLGSGALLQRTAASLASLERMERYRGHFFNWYDTRSLQPLKPHYVSAVDSGNLAVYLLILRAGLLELAENGHAPERLLAGLQDTLANLDGYASELPLQPLLAGFAAELDAAAAQPVWNQASWHATLRRLQAAAEVLPDMGPSAAEPAFTHDAQTWIEALRVQCRDALGELEFCLPWLAAIERADADSPAGGRAAARFAAQMPLPGTKQLASLAGSTGGLEEAPLQAWLQSASDPPAVQALLAGEGDDGTDEDDGEAHILREHIALGARRARSRLQTAATLAQRCGALAQMDFGFLYDRERRLLHIGYNADTAQLDSGHYDLLASEARQCVFMAIAQGQLPQESWFALGRLLTQAADQPVLLSWSGSMFEYLMPGLVMPDFPGTLLGQTARAAVARQIEYGRQRDTPWGISESGYNAIDRERHYQYRAFGVPGLGLKRGLSDDLVVAPYASVLALMVAPQAACANLQRLAAAGLDGRYGLFEAIDYTPARQQPGQDASVVRSFMAHHQGMSLLALLWLLREQPMQRRFAADRHFQAAMLLLQERVPHVAAALDHTAQLSGMAAAAPIPEAPVRRFDRADTAAPEVKLLSNGRYHVMLTHVGGGYSRWNGLALTRWREDFTRDCHGSFCFVRDLSSGKLWATTHQPLCDKPLQYQASFSGGRAEFHRRDRVSLIPGLAGPARPGKHSAEIETCTEIAVSPEHDIELRRVRIINHSRQRRSIELTTYAEVVLAPQADDLQHPAFSKLFVHTEVLRGDDALLCTRRARSNDERPPWMLHLVAVRAGAVAGAVDVSHFSAETDRERFIGRNRTLEEAQALAAPGPLSGTAGAVLDAVMAIRCSFSIEAGECAVVDLVTGAAPSRELACGLIDIYRDRGLTDRVFELSWTHNLVMLRQLSQTEAQAQLSTRLAGAILYANPALRAHADILLHNRRGQSGLWAYGISGDLPIVLLQLADSDGLELVRQVLHAHAFWQQKGLAVDLVIWNEERAGYRQSLQDEVMALVTCGMGASALDRAGGIFVRMAEQIAPEDRLLLQSVARVVLSDRAGSLEEQLERLYVMPQPAQARGRLRAVEDEPPAPVALGPAPREDLILDNGLGGFSADGREYVITLGAGRRTPAPWVNVLANADFGSIVSKSGGSYTWCGNAHAFRLTPWDNDPVTDSSGEALYLRDEDSAQVWSPTGLPVSATMARRIRHGFGYSVFESEVEGIATELWMFVAADAPVKFWLLRLANRSAHRRRLSATLYVDWVLGDVRANSAPHVRTWIDPHSGALSAANAFGAEFAERVAFLDCDDRDAGFTADRTRFIGRNGRLRAPAAMRQRHLSGRTGAGFDSCGALRTLLELGPGEEREIVLRLGCGANAEDASALVGRFRGLAAARAALAEVQHYWQRTLQTIQVQTPDAATNVLANGWLCYQTLACRIWARSGYYQSGGAYGFRDQLQDGMALVHAAPALVREHLLRSASRQFEAGDVQHWWHPPGGRGVRTRCSDDYLWLPLAVSRYVECTGDADVLDEDVGFLEGLELKPDEDSRYDLPSLSASRASLYEHCKRAIRLGMRSGPHGLPLIGGGDWNDGMSRVGLEGRGESVWLGFFQIEVLRRFATIARQRNDAVFARRCSSEAGRLRAAIEAHAWDGDWYRRAWFDDGTPLGSASSAECRIDSISQSWAVLSAAADRERARRAMDAAASQLIDEEQRVMALLAPPFASSALDPGYIRGYPPGVRENGGQYTHAAVWTAMAFAELGEHDRAWRLAQLMNPVNHTATAAAQARYRVEPYVMAADIYACPPHVGRGGWSWYTGSAGWMYRLLVETLLGLRIEAGVMRLQPRLPSHWNEAELRYRHGDTPYRIRLRRRAQPDGSGGLRAQLDDEAVDAGAIPLHDDGKPHRIEVELPAIDGRAIPAHAME